jgi:hypothetical protein
LEVDASAVPQQHVEQFIQTLEGMVEGGSVFAPGQTLQVGWMITQVQRYDETRLTLFEPDMRSLPVKYVPGVTETLRQMMLQLFVIDSLGVTRNEMDIPSIRQSVVVCDRYLEASGVLLMRGKAQNKSDSGWFIGCLDKEHDHQNTQNLAKIPLYDAFLNRNAIQGWMAFPSGTLIALQGGQPPQVFRDGKELMILPDSFLDRLHHRPETG